MKNKIISLLFGLRIDLQKEKCATCGSCAWIVPTVMNHAVLKVSCRRCNTRINFIMADGQLMKIESVEKE